MSFFNLKNFQSNGHTNGISTSPTGASPTGREMVAIGDYTAQYSDELTFSEGEIIQVLRDGKV